MAGFGAEKQILVVGNEGVHLYVLKGKTVSLFRDFSDAGGNLSSELRGAFRSLKMPLVVLFDVVEQQYRRENIPKVGFMDKAKVINRKLAMAFPQQQLRSYLLSKQKGRDEGIVALFAGLAPNLTVTQIMDAILSSEVYVSGAGLLPLESTSMVTKLLSELHQSTKARHNARWTIMMTQHKTGGIRQIVVKEGELALTRMTPIVIDINRAESFTDEIVREFNATLTYLSRFGYIPADGLELCVISTPAINQRLRQYQLPVNELYTLTPEEAGKFLKMKPVMTSDMAGFGEILHAGWTGMQSRLAVSLSSPLLDRIRNARMFARVAIFALFLGALYLGWQLWNLQSNITNTKNDIEIQKNQQVTLQNDLDALTKKLDTLKQDPEKIRKLMDIYQEYQKLNIDIRPTLNALLSVLDSRKFFLTELNISQEEKQGAAAQLALPVEPLPDGSLPKKVVKIEMTIDFPASLTVEQSARNTLEFAETLRKRFPGRDISIVEMVGDLAIDKTVQGTSQQPGAGEKGAGMTEKKTSKIEFKGSVE